MLYVDMAGRCGNQLFHYACARYIMICTGETELTLNFAAVDKNQNILKGSFNYLKDFQVVPYKLYRGGVSVFRQESNLLQKLCIISKKIHIKVTKNQSHFQKSKGASFLQSFLNWSGVYWILEGINEIKIYKRKNMLLSGVCETGILFDSIKEKLIEEFTPKNNISIKFQKLYDEIQLENSVCIHVRRGDFFNQENIDSFGVCTSHYYIEAQKYLEQKLVNAKYFVFSDDIAWCKEHLSLKGHIVYIPEELPVSEVLRFMYSCKHYIISNSTLSWWGQYLSRNDNKLVVSPSRWNNNGYIPSLIQKNWILIEP